MTDLPILNEEIQRRCREQVAEFTDAVSIEFYRDEERGEDVMKLSVAAEYIANFSPDQIVWPPYSPDYPVGVAQDAVRSLRATLYDMTHPTPKPDTEPVVADPETDPRENWIADKPKGHWQA